MSAALDLASEPTAATAGRPVLQARSLVKRFGRVVALDHADFDLMPNEILGVIGDNGAGKSTLIKVLAGAIIPDSGQVVMDGAPVQFKNPMEARSAGIETVYQDLALCPNLSVVHNLELGNESKRDLLRVIPVRDDRVDVPLGRLEQYQRHIDPVPVPLRREGGQPPPLMPYPYQEPGGHRRAMP